MEEDTKTEGEEGKLILSVFLPYMDRAKQLSRPLSEFKDTSHSNLGFWGCLCSGKVSIRVPFPTGCLPEELLLLFMALFSTISLGTPGSEQESLLSVHSLCHK